MGNNGEQGNQIEPVIKEVGQRHYFEFWLTDEEYKRLTEAATNAHMSAALFLNSAILIPLFYTTITEKEKP